MFTCRYDITLLCSKSKKSVNFCYHPLTTSIHYLLNFWSCPWGCPSSNILKSLFQLLPWPCVCDTKEKRLVTSNAACTYEEMQCTWNPADAVVTLKVAWCSDIGPKRLVHTQDLSQNNIPWALKARSKQKKRKKDTFLKAGQS